MICRREDAGNAYPKRGIAETLRNIRYQHDAPSVTLSEVEAWPS